VVEEDAVVLGDIEKAHRPAGAGGGHGAEGELDGLVFRLEGDADDIVGGGLGEIDFGEGSFVV
jgi:hypothetical protein